MRTTDFSEISARYERDSLIQRSAAEKLIGLLDIRRGDDVLDLGCGTGAVTRRMRSLTDGRVAGVDPSEGMVREAEEHRGGLDIELNTNSAEGMNFKSEFSVIFCNSAFQWFRDPHRALGNCHRALRPGGSMGIQAPAKKEYCPNFLSAIDAVSHDPRTAKTFSGFRPPWLFYEIEEEYSALFRDAGFEVPFAKIETVTTYHAPGEVMTIFESGAAAGYLNQEYYSSHIDGSYADDFRDIVRNTFSSQTEADGKVGLVFNRIYLVAVK